MAHFVQLSEETGYNYHNGSLVYESFKTASQAWKIISSARKLVIVISLILVLGGTAIASYGVLNVWCNKQILEKFPNFEERKEVRTTVGLTEAVLGIGLLTLGGMIVLQERGKPPNSTSTSLIYLGPSVVIGFTMLLTAVSYRLSFPHVC